ncbi:MAG: hypothetical protein QXG03_08310 [Halalkalicoccus sp.]
MNQTASDKGLGLGLLFGLLAALGTVAMFVAPGGLVGAWGFAAAMVAAMVLIVAVHAYA